MEKPQKQEQIDLLKGIFSNVESMVLTGVEGMNATDVTVLRRNMKASGVNFKVFKNKLARIAAKDLPVSVLSDDFAGSTAIAWSNDDAVLPAKSVFKFKAGNEAFKIKSGFTSGKRLDFAALEALSKLPGLPDLRGQLLGLMNSVLARLLAQVNAPASNIVGVIQAKSDKDKE